MKNPEFVNAQEMARNHPHTFGVPSKEELDSIKKGSSVKVSAGNERFWVTVDEVNGDELTGFVDNDLICSDEHGLEYGSPIAFKKENIYAIY